MRLATRKAEEKAIREIELAEAQQPTVLGVIEQFMAKQWSGA